MLTGTFPYFHYKYHISISQHSKLSLDEFFYETTFRLFAQHRLSISEQHHCKWNLTYIPCFFLDRKTRQWCCRFARCCSANILLKVSRVFVKFIIVSDDVFIIIIDIIIVSFCWDWRFLLNEFTVVFLIICIWTKQPTLCLKFYFWCNCNSIP